MAKTKKPSGDVAFENYFTSVYKERWPAIKEGLMRDDLKVARQNTFFKDSQYLQEILKTPSLGVLAPFDQEGLTGCFVVGESFDLNQFSTTLLPFYRMDPASILAAKALEVKANDRVLDMCAAPGGKTLVLAEALGGTGSLTANELSPKRRFRLMSVVKRYIPAEHRGSIDIQGRDGAKFGLMTKTFNRILLDAPCSGERGVLHKQSDLALWKEKRTKSFAVKQYSLLASAFLCLEPGGRIVYSTCSISPHENDGVVHKLHQRKAGEFKMLAPEFTRGHPTQYGWQFLPDQGGWGPIFLAVIEKNSE